MGRFGWVGGWQFGLWKKSGDVLLNLLAAEVVESLGCSFLVGFGALLLRRAEEVGGLVITEVLLEREGPGNLDELLSVVVDDNHVLERDWFLFLLFDGGVFGGVVEFVVCRFLCAFTDDAGQVAEVTRFADVDVVEFAHEVD
jgi:hypothetical protein